jgi:argininosuccinate lyase
MANSLDAVSARDFAAEFLAAGSILAVHLSRLAEEIVLWSSSAFGFITLSDAFSTGSSIMPQKRNPDAAELVRAKSGRVIGSLNTLLVALKGLPLAYAKDMQEDKEPVFDAADTLHLCLVALAGMIGDLRVNADAMRAAAGAGFATATDLADWLVREAGMPFRQAHEVTGRIVRLAESKGSLLEDLPLDDMQAIEPGITADVYNVLSVEKSVASRQSYGGTAPGNVRKAAAKFRERLIRSE